MLNAVEDTVFIFDPATGRALYWNQAFKDVSGCTHEEIAHRRAPDEWYEGVDLERAAAASRELLEHGKARVKLSLRTRSGSHVPTEYSATLIHDVLGVEQAIVAVGRDLTARKHVERIRLEGERRYRELLEAIDDVVVVLDHDLNIVMFNDAAAQRLGWSREQLAQTDYRDLFSGHEDTPFFKTVVQVLETREPAVTVGEFRHEAESRWFELTVYPVPEGVMFFSRDVTEQRRVEDRLKQSQKMEAIGTLAGGIAHDFNNLLMAVQGRVSLMLHGLAGEHPHRPGLEEIEDIVESATAVTRQLLGFARGGKYEVKPTDLNELVLRCVSMFSRTRKEIRFHTKTDPTLPTVEVDRGQLEQVMLNLFLNAWQAMPRGGEVFVETERFELDHRDVEPPSVTPGVFAKVAVTDTGRGMDEATIERVFEPFFTTKVAGHGTGLGLASAYGIVTNHHGTIEALSPPGQGATFTIHLPASSQAVPLEIQPASDPSPGSERVLIIDDEPMVRNVTSHMLGELGYGVGVAATGTEGIEILAQNGSPIDLVVLDMILPGEDALQLFEQIRELRPAVKVLVSSGYSLSDPTSAALREGCDGFIQKPFNLAALSAKVRALLDPHQEPGGDAP